MSTEDKQLVEWIEHAKASDVSDLADYMNAIIDFKSALREEIEKELSECKVSLEQYKKDPLYKEVMVEQIETLEWVLETINSLTPKK